MKKLQDQVTEFHRVMGQPVATVPTMLDTERKRLRLGLILEEVQELAEALGASTAVLNAIELAHAYAGTDRYGARDAGLVAAADALGDIAYVVAGCAVEMGIPLGAVTDEVHASNMTKRGGEKRADGKILKPATYRPPNIAAVLARCSSSKCTDPNGGT